MMEDPIPVDKVQAMSTEEKIKYENARHTRNLQTGFLTVLGIVILCFFVPLGVFLTRLAMGV